MLHATSHRTNDVDGTTAGPAHQLMNALATSAMNRVATAVKPTVQTRLKSKVRRTQPMSWRAMASV